MAIESSKVSWTEIEKKTKISITNLVMHKNGRNITDPERRFEDKMIDFICICENTYGLRKQILKNTTFIIHKHHKYINTRCFQSHYVFQIP